MTAPQVQRSTPVFVDTSGRRNRLVQVVSWLVTASVLGYLALVALSLVLPPGLGPLRLPGLPGPAAAPLAPSAQDVLQGRAGPVTPSPRASRPTPSPTGSDAPPGTAGVPTLAAVPVTTAAAPTPRPVPGATNRPTTIPRTAPTTVPTTAPTAPPTAAPGKPTAKPTGKPTAQPTGRPTTPPGLGKKAG